MSVVPIAAAPTKRYPSNRPVLPEWTRWAWASVDEQGWWEPYLRDITRMLSTIELESLVRGVRAAAWVACPPSDLPQLAEWALGHDLAVLPRQISAAADGYTAGCVPLHPGDPWQYRVLVVRIDRWRDVPPASDDERLGRLLAYPACCCRFFRETWGSGQVDTTWDQYANTGTADGPVEANMLWRWLGPRWVLHLPCSSTCTATVELGTQFRELALRLGYVEEAQALDEILRWPVDWSAVNGIAQIVGPCVKVSTRTDWCPEPRQFHRAGTYTSPEAWLWTENGFASAAGMREAHDPLVRAMKEHAPPGARVCDLGCGNGWLLHRVRMKRPDIAIGGVDVNEDAIAHARQRLIGRWTVGNIGECRWTDAQPTVALLSPNRLAPEEMAPADADRVRQVLRRLERIFVVAYSDNIQLGSLPALCAAAGLPNPAVISASAAVAIGVIDGHDLG